MVSKRGRGNEKNVLIVAKCNVNPSVYAGVQGNKELIVAKCNVNA